jgi:hypothetical protein
MKRMVRRSTFSTPRNVLVLVGLVVIALAVLEVVGYGPIGLATRFNAWRAARKAAA